jgi:hypothetical protein
VIVIKLASVALIAYVQVYAASLVSSKKSPEGVSDVVTRKYAVAEVYGVNA